MPTLPAIRYPFDPTGVDRNNFIADEVHTLNDRPVRVIAPKYGPMYSEHTVVYDAITRQPLTKGNQFQCVEILQEATLITGFEVTQLILILDPAVSNQVKVSYQIVGGQYANDASAIAEMYETVMKDNRPIDWVNVFNKPYEYPPSLHRHLLEDIYGFEPVVVALERIRNAITLGQVPAYERLIEWVKNYCKRLGDRLSLIEKGTVTEEEIIAGVPVNKYVTFERLLFALDKFNFNGTKITPSIATTRNGATITFDVDTTNVRDGKTLFWTIEHVETTDDDFEAITGSFLILGNKGQFTVRINRSKLNEAEEHFRVILRRESVTGPEMGYTSLITVKKYTAIKLDFIDYALMCCQYHPMNILDPVATYMTEFNT